MDTPRPFSLGPPLDEAQLPPPGVEVTHVRGLIQNIVKGILAQDMEPQAWEAYLGALGPEARALIGRDASEYEWVSMAALVEAVGKHPSTREGITTVLRGNLYADLMMTEKHRWMLKIMTPELMVSQAPRIFAFYHRGGVMAAERVEPGRAAATLFARGPTAAWFGILIPTWFKRSLELSGGNAVEVTHEPPEATGVPDLHRYWLSWA